MKKVLAILLTAVMLLSLTVTAYAEGDTGNSKITAKLADMISSAEADSKLPVAVTADLSISAVVREGFERYACEQVGMPYGDYLPYYDRGSNGMTGEELAQWNLDNKKWKQYENILYGKLKETRLAKLNSVLDASGADIEDMDSGFYTTGCLEPPRRIMMTAEQIYNLAQLDLVTALDASDYVDRVPGKKDYARKLSADLAERLKSIGEDERVTVAIQYKYYISPYDRVYDSKKIFTEMYGISADVNRVKDGFGLWHTYLIGTGHIGNDYNYDYLELLRLKTLDLSDEDIILYNDDGRPEVRLLNLTEAKLYEIMRDDEIDKVDLVDPYGNPPTPDEPEPGYFIVGTMTDWKLDPGYRIYKAYQNPRLDEAANNKYIFHLYMTPDDAFKIVYSPDGKTLDNATYSPEGRGNAFNQENPIILKKGFYTFTFRPACDGGISYFESDDGYYTSYGNGVQVWYYNCIYCKGRDPWKSGYNYTNPDPEHNDPEPGYYLVGTMTDWQLNKRFMCSTDTGVYGAEIASDITLRMGDRFKVAYSEDGVNITRWYPEGEGNAFNEDINRIGKLLGDSPYYTVNFYPYGNGMSYDSLGSCHYGYISLSAWVPASGLAPYPIPAEGELFKAKLKADYRLSDKDFTEYEELCYHKDKDGLPDWTLLKAKTAKTSEQTYRAIIANRVCEHEQSASLFGSGYGIYDAAEKRFIPLTDDIVGRYKDLGRIFDNLGSGRLIGDVDSDDELTAIDCTLIQRCATRICDWPEDDIVDSEGLDLVYFSDFDRDGERDIVDATRLQRYVTYIG